ncbi:MAG: hypothetical protein IPH58_14380 [Sphingobacteriales bacterium]|jgi:hypothetical protein|nr:hypothetical protein [Sphingobacteriales bacterium]
MKTNIYATIFCAFLTFSGFQSYAQTKQGDNNRIDNQQVKIDPKAPKKTNTEKEVEESLQKAAQATERAAEKLKVVIEQKADKVAKASKPYMENFLIATSNLIEKLAVEIEKMVDEKPVKNKSDR